MIPHVVQIRDEAKNLVNQKNGEVKNRIVDALVEKEIKSRTEILTSAFERRDVLIKELDAIKPDFVQYDAAGNKLTEAYSKATIDKRNKAQSNLDKLDQAITLAIDTADYSAVQKIVANKNSDKQEKTDSTEQT